MRRKKKSMLQRAASRRKDTPLRVKGGERNKLPWIRPIPKSDGTPTTAKPKTPGMSKLPISKWPGTPRNWIKPVIDPPGGNLSGRPPKAKGPLTKPAINLTDSMNKQANTDMAKKKSGLDDAARKNAQQQVLDRLRSEHKLGGLPAVRKAL
jgi:hypothetical protein